MKCVLMFQNNVLIIHREYIYILVCVRAGSNSGGGGGALNIYW